MATVKWRVGTSWHRHRTCSDLKYWTKTEEWKIVVWTIIRGHVFCSFLALVLRKELETRLEKHGAKPEWADINRDLRALQEVEVEMHGKKLYLRTDLRGVCHTVLQAAGVAVPPTVRE